MSTQDTPEGRAQAVAALREIADMLEACPWLPAPYYGSLQAGPTSSKPGAVRERFAAVRAAAQHLGVDVVENQNGSREARRGFGPISYVVHVAGTKIRMPDGRRVVPAAEDFGECLDERMVTHDADADAQAEADVANAVNLVPVDYDPRVLDDLEALGADPEGPALWLVWSHEHGAWWKPARWGYTGDAAKAGRYSAQEAQAICAKAAYGWREGVPPEVMVPASALDLSAAIIAATDLAIAAKAKAVA